MMTSSRTCTKCGLTRTIDHFYVRKSGALNSWCKSCYRDWYAARNGGMVTSPCGQCGEPMLVTSRRASEPHYCSRACKDIAKNAARQAAVDAAKPERECAYCAALLPRSMRADAKFCSADCNMQAHRQTRNFRRRAGEEAPKRPRKKPLINLAAIAKRDKYRCGICGDRVDMKLKHPDPGFPSLDHIVPLAHGGDDLNPANLQLAHLRCNLSKRDKGGGDQLRLIG